MADTVRMIREEWEANGGPLVADVHPAEVQNYAVGGWRRAEPAPDAGEDAQSEDETATEDAPRRGRPRKG